MSDALHEVSLLRDDVLLNALPGYLKVSGPLTGSNTNRYHALFKALPEIVAALWHEAPLSPLFRSYITWERIGDILPEVLAFFLVRQHTDTEAKAAIRTLLQTWLSLEAELSGAKIEWVDLALPKTHPLVKAREAFIDHYDEVAWEYIATQANGKRAFVRLSHVEGDTVFLRLTARAGELVLPEGVSAPLKQLTLFSRVDFLRELLAEEATRGAVSYTPKTDEAKLLALLPATSLDLTQVVLWWVGLPQFDNYVVDFLGKELRTTLKLKQKDAKVAREGLLDGFLRGQGALEAIAAMTRVAQASDLWGDKGLATFGEVLAQRAPKEA